MSIFIWGDAIVILPWVIFCILLSLYNSKAGLFLLLTGLSIRYLAEIGYWLFQQFGPRTYRPYDYGFKNLSNNSIYILYQLTSTVTAASLLVLLKLIYG